MQLWIVIFFFNFPQKQFLSHTRKEITGSLKREQLMTRATISNSVSSLNFHSLEAVCRYRDTQLLVIENYSYLFHFRQIICKS